VPVTDLPEFSRAARGANGNGARKRAPSKSAPGPRGSTQDEQPVVAAPVPREPAG
jgi:hypothetical protein